MRSSRDSMAKRLPCSLRRRQTRILSMRRSQRRASCISRPTTGRPSPCRASSAWRACGGRSPILHRAGATPCVSMVAPNQRELRKLKHRHIRSPPYSDGSELDECEVVVGVFFVSRGDGAEVLEFVEEALDEVSVTIKKGTESRRVEASGHWFDARPGAAFLDRLTQSVG